MHGCPSFNKQAPAPLHALLPAQVFTGKLSSLFFRTFVHAPTLFVTLQALHVPLHEESQHTPSTQLPLTHSLGMLHDCPFFNKQNPALVHAFVPVHGVVPIGSSCPPGRSKHFPALFGWLHE
jgi:hypothetical protein